MRYTDALDRLAKDHKTYPPAPEADIKSISQRIGYALPTPVCEFYRRTNGALLFPRQDSICRILPLKEVSRTRQFLYGTDHADYGPASFICLAEASDAGCLSVDLAPGADYGNIFFCYALEFPEEMTWAANSFPDFLVRAVDCDNDYWW